MRPVCSLCTFLSIHATSLQSLHVPQRSCDRSAVFAHSSAFIDQSAVVARSSALIHATSLQSLAAVYSRLTAYIGTFALSKLILQLLSVTPSCRRYARTLIGVRPYMLVWPLLAFSVFHTPRNFIHIHG